MSSPLAVVGRLRRIVDDGRDETSADVFDIARDAPFVIGRQQGVDVRFVEPAVSRRHAVFQVVDERMVLKNMSKLNPVSLNDSILDVETAVALRHGDRVGIQLTSEEEATFVFEHSVDNVVVVRSPLRENGGNTPLSVSPLKSPKSNATSTPSRDDAENVTPKSPAKSALKAPENRLAVRPSTARRRSISFAGEEALEAIKWIAPHDGKVELCGRIAPLALDAPRSPRRRRSTSKSPKSAVKQLPAPEVPLMLPAPETKRRSSISFKAVEDGEENDTPDSRFTRGGARMQRNDTPRASSRRKSPALRSPSQFSPIGTLDGSEGETLAEKTESVEAMTPPNDSNNLIARMECVATPSSEMKRPGAPNNTPIAADFNLDGYNVFRTTPSAMPEGLRELFADNGTSDVIMRAVETLEAEAERDVDAAKELDSVLAGLPTPPSTKKRVREWLEAENDFDGLPEEEDAEGPEAQPSAEYASPAKSIIVKCRKTKKRRRCGGGKALSARMEQLHRALSATRRALLKERKKNATLQEMYTELVNAPREEPPTPAEMKTPKIHMHINVKEATPKTPKVAMHVNVREAAPKTPKVTLNVNVKETPPKLAVETEKKEEEEKEKDANVAVSRPPSDCCSVCAVVDKCKTVRCDDCSIIFHLKCLKPRLTRTPKGPWTCAECEKRDSKPAATKTTKPKTTTITTTTRSTRSTRSSRRM